jgi:outer membrane receptor protein involved in Fe transport
MKDQSSISSPANALPGTSSYDIFDLFGSLKISPKYSISAGIDNIADRAPNILTGVLGVTDTGTYDPIGRRFYVNVKASL